MRTVYLLILAGVIGLIGGCTTAESHVREGFDFSQMERVAVVDVTGAVASEAAKNQIADFFVMELLRKGFAPIERGQVQALLKEQKFQTSDVTTPEGAAKAGRILNVSAVILINVPNFNEEMSMTAKMIDVEDGSVLWMGIGSGRTSRTLSTIAGVAGGAAAGASAAGKDNETIGAIAGGVLGGIAGQALTPQKADKAQDIVAKMCESMPHRY